MQKIEVTIPGGRSYPILVGVGALARIGEVINFERYSKVTILTDSTVAENWLSKVRALLPPRTDSIILPPGENQKGVSTIAQVWGKFAEAGLDRRSLLLNLGGGVIGDLGGFAASTYMRGIDFAHIPTTLLAQVDSSIGGKTGIDHVGIKNLVGTFAQPVAVIAEIGMLATLPQRECLAGFAEVIKHALIKDAKYLELLLSKAVEEFEDSELSNIIAQSIQIKRVIVQNDEKESGPRKLLNFGHTVGHAIEAASLESKVPLLHGEAISLGMLAEAKLSVEQKLLSSNDLHTVEKAINHFQLPQRLPPAITSAEIFKRMALDKKNVAGKIKFTLLKKVGEGVWDQDVPHDIVARIIETLR